MLFPLLQEQKDGMLACLDDITSMSPILRSSCSSLDCFFVSLKSPTTIKQCAFSCSDLMNVRKLSSNCCLGSGLSIFLFRIIVHCWLYTVEGPDRA